MKITSVEGKEKQICTVKAGKYQSLTLEFGLLLDNIFKLDGSRWCQAKDI